MDLCENPNAVPLLEQYPEKIDWRILSRNPEAMYLLEKNVDKMYLDFAKKMLPIF
jgi:hypothetical protein